MNYTAGKPHIASIHHLQLNRFGNMRQPACAHLTPELCTLPGNFSFAWQFRGSRPHPGVHGTMNQLVINEMFQNGSHMNTLLSAFNLWCQVQFWKLVSANLISTQQRYCTFLTLLLLVRGSPNTDPFSTSPIRKSDTLKENRNTKQYIQLGKNETDQRKHIQESVYVLV